MRAERDDFDCYSVQKRHSAMFPNPPINLEINDSDFGSPSNTVPSFVFTEDGKKKKTEFSLTESVRITNTVFRVG